MAIPKGPIQALEAALSRSPGDSQGFSLSQAFEAHQAVGQQVVGVTTSVLGVLSLGSARLLQTFSSVSM